MAGRITAAVTRHHGKQFTVVPVRRGVAHGQNAYETIAAFEVVFPGGPVILMEESHSGRTRWFGQADIVRMLTRISSGQLPWRDYYVNSN